MKLTEFKKVVYKKCDNKISARDKLIVDIASQVFEARVKSGLTQEQLAKLIGTKQPAIARLEAGNISWLPSLELLFKIANALKTELIAPKFAFIDKGAVILSLTERKEGIFDDDVNSSLNEERYRPMSTDVWGISRSGKQIKYIF